MISVALSLTSGCREMSTELAADLLDSAAYTTSSVLLSNVTGSLYSADCVARPAGNSQESF